MHPLVVHCKQKPYDVYIGRPSKWGNPYVMSSLEPARQRQDVIRLYRDWLERERPDLIEDAKLELRGKVLGCFCAPLPCHGDVLAEIANVQTSLQA